MPAPAEPLAVRFFRKVRVPTLPNGLWDETQCWLWVGAKCGGRPHAGEPYGHMYVETVKDEAGGRKEIYRKAHVISFFLAYGRWSELDICHKCDNPLCVNPLHLFEASHRLNMIDYVKKYGRLGIPKTERPLPPRPQLPYEPEEVAV